MDNCKDLGIFMNEIMFLMNRINGNVRALNQIRQENNTENLRERESTYDRVVNVVSEIANGCSL